MQLHAGHLLIGLKYSVHPGSQVTEGQDPPLGVVVTMVVMALRIIINFTAVSRLFLFLF